MRSESLGGKARPGSLIDRFVAILFPFIAANWHKLRVRKSVVPFLYLTPAALILLLIYFYPVIRVIHDGLYRYTGGKPIYIGLWNYQQLLFNTPDVRTAFINNVRLLGIIPIILVISIIVAFIFNEGIPGGRFYETAIFLPTVFSVVLVGVIFSFLLRPSGLLNQFLRNIGLPFLAQNWFGNPRVAIMAIMATMIWKELGFGIMLFRSRLSSLDPELFDAARVDGANSVQLLVYIIVPQLVGIIEFFVIYYIIAVFASVFGYVYIITYGGPAKSTTVLDFEIYQYAFMRNSRGEATALSFLLLLGALIFIYLEYRLRVSHDEAES